MGQNKSGNQRAKRTSQTEIRRDMKLSRDGIGFLKGLDNKIQDINLYLSQNRYSILVKEYKPDGKLETWLEPFLMNKLKERPMESNQFYHKKMNRLLLEGLWNRNEELMKTFPGYQRYEFQFPGRMMLGDGGNTPYSNIVLLKLHPLYGVPYVPASTIKGGVRNCWNVLAAEKEMERQQAKALEHKLFGSVEEENGEMGNLIFFDAFPKEFNLTLDIQSVHFKNYYMNGGEPTDDQNLNIIHFICLEQASFSMMAACRKEALWNEEKSMVGEAFQKFAEEYGVGAKTALGYGIGKMCGV